MIEVGNKYHRLTVLRTWVEKKWGIHARFCECQCECGNVKTVRSTALTTGNTKSCGCYNIEKIISRNYKHGVGNHSLKGVYYSMIRRCSDENHKAYKWYGARGIKVCEEWTNDMKKFIKWCESNGYKENLQLDRIDTDGDYEPNNCRFISAKDNHRNMRSNVFINGLCLRDYLDKISNDNNIPYPTVRYRYYNLKKRDIPTTEDNIVNYRKNDGRRKQG